MKKRFTIIALAVFMATACIKTDTGDAGIDNPKSPSSLTRTDEPHFLDQFDSLKLRVTIHSPKGIASFDEDLYLTRAGSIPGAEYYGNETGFKMLQKRTGDKAHTQHWYLVKVPNSNGLFILKSAFADLSPESGFALLDTKYGHHSPTSFGFRSNNLHIATASNGKKMFYFPTKTFDEQQPYAGCFQVLSDAYNPANKYIRRVEDSKTYYYHADYGVEQVAYFKENDTSIYRTFRITSVEDFFLQSIHYNLGEGSRAIPIPSFIDEIVVNNATPTQQQMTATFSNKVTEQTTFTRGNSQSVNTSLKLSFSVTTNVPWVNVSGGLEQSASAGATWDYSSGETQSQEDSRQYSFTLVVPGNSSYRATISVARYETQASYTATFRAQISGRTMVETGTWNGINAGLITYDIIDNSTNQHVARIYGTPTEPIDIMKAKGKVLDFREKNIQLR